MLNKVHLIGRVGKEPQSRITASGMQVVNFSMATSKKTKGEEKTQWHRCIAFGKTAEVITQYVTKGTMLYVEGEISYGQYENDGITRYTTDIIVNQFNFLSKKGDIDSGGGNNTVSWQSEDIPF